jgi:gamma-glutamyltranspeptidase/glutathione hydrolase
MNTNEHEKRLLVGGWWLLARRAFLPATSNHQPATPSRLFIRAHSCLFVDSLFLLLALILAPAFVDAEVATAPHGMVASVHPLATDAGVNALKSGGNAIDAAIATALTLGVVDGHNSGIGGGCFMLIRTADGKNYCLDGREMAPAAATADMFVRNGKGDTTLSQNGALASGVPGSLAVYAYAAEHFGKKKLADLITPAAQIADAGFPIDDKYAGKLKSTAKLIAKFPDTAAILLKPDGSPYQAGEILKQTDLAKTYRAIAEQGTDYYYHGPFAQAVEKWMKANGGILTAADYANYQMKLRDPLVTSYRGYTIIGFPPPSSGGLHVAQILSMLERFDLGAMEKSNPAQRVSVMADAMDLAFADRAYFLGDPDFVHVPTGLLDPGYLASRSKLIDPNHALPQIDHGNPPAFDTEYFGKHTTHISTADDQGNWVALTTTVNTAFGSKVIIPGTGVIMNDQMDDFSIQPGVANAFKLVGSDANAVAAGKRPCSCMSPTIVLKDGKPIMTVGAAGGPKIITQVVLLISNVIDLHDDLGTAIARPRFHDQWSPAELWIENNYPADILAALEKMGHKLDRAKPTGATQAIEREPDGTFIGASEPRVPGKAAGY